MPIPRGVSDIPVLVHRDSATKDFVNHRVSRHRRWGATTANYSDDCRPYEICSPRRSLAEASWPDVSSALGHSLRLTRQCTHALDHVFHHRCVPTRASAEAREHRPSPRDAHRVRAPRPVLTHHDAAIARNVSRPVAKSATRRDTRLTRRFYPISISRTSVVRGERLLRRAAARLQARPSSPCRRSRRRRRRTPGVGAGGGGHAGRCRVPRRRRRHRRRV